MSCSTVVGKSLETSLTKNCQLPSSITLHWLHSIAAKRLGAIALYQQVLPLRRLAGDLDGEAATLSCLGDAYLKTRQLDKARNNLQDALAILRQIGDLIGIANTLRVLAEVHLKDGHMDEARSALEEALTIANEMSSNAVKSAVLGTLGEFHHRSGKLPLACRYLNDALEGMREVGNRIGEANTLNSLAITKYDQGKAEVAHELAQKALTIIRETGDRWNEAAVHSNFAFLLRDEGDTQGAIKHLRTAAQIEHENDFFSLEAADLFHLAETLIMAGDGTNEALELLYQSIAILRSRDLDQDETGRPLTQHLDLLLKIQNMLSPLPDTGNLSTDALSRIVASSVAVLTMDGDNLDAWRNQVRKALEKADAADKSWRNERDLMRALVTMLDMGAASLPEDHLVFSCARIDSSRRRCVEPAGSGKIDGFPIPSGLFLARLVP